MLIASHMLIRSYMLSLQVDMFTIALHLEPPKGQQGLLQTLEPPLPVLPPPPPAAAAAAVVATGGTGVVGSGGEVLRVTGVRSGRKKQEVKGLVASTAPALELEVLGVEQSRPRRNRMPSVSICIQC